MSAFSYEANGEGASVAVSVQPARELTELERIQLQMNTTTDASLESTRRMVQYTQEAQSAGANTLTMLDEQGEKLNRAEAGLDKINADMKIAEKHVTKLEQCCCCACFWSKAPDFESKPEYKATWESSSKTTTANGSSAGSPDKQAPGAAPYEGNYITRITNDAREDEMEDNVRVVASTLSALKNQASTMNDELTRQNEQIERMRDKADRNQQRVNDANVRMAGIVGKK